jgi:oxygen-dependent protoporphyrinogen oxidase
VSTLNPTHVVSALPLPCLHAITQPNNTDDVSPSKPPLHLTANPSSSVHVLNLVFPGPPSQIHPSGFGYLIPRPREGYPSHATDAQPGILGVVFDSCTSSEQDQPNLSPEDWYYKGTHTKISVMLGGPYPLYIPSTTPDFPPSTTTPIDIPYHIQVIINHLSTHFNHTLPAPTYYHLWRNTDCIPTYLPGHLERMNEMKSILQRDISQGGWGGKLQVIGAGVDGVSVPDCVLAGRNAGLSWL